MSYYSVMYSTVYHRPQQLFYMPELVLLALFLLFSVLLAGVVRNCLVFYFTKVQWSTCRVSCVY